MIRLLGYLFMVSSVGVLGWQAHDICKRCNMSYVSARRADLVKNAYHSSQGTPFLRDVSYLPEEDYMEKLEETKNEPQILNRDNRNLLPEYRSLCEIVTKRVLLDDSEYEYQPPHYHEVYCKNFSGFGNNQRSVNPSKQKCVQPGFHCVQRSKTLFFVRRRWDSECWESYDKEVASGCDCMWPVSILGEIASYY